MRDDVSISPYKHRCFPNFKTKKNEKLLGDSFSFFFIKDEIREKL